MFIQLVGKVLWAHMFSFIAWQSKNGGMETERPEGKKGIGTVLCSVASVVLDSLPPYGLYVAHQALLFMFWIVFQKLIKG